MKTLRMNIGRYATAKLQVTMLCIVAALAVIGCKHDEPPAPQSQPTLPNGVKIYKGEGVTDAQFATAVQNAITGYNNVRPEYGCPNGKFTKLVIASGGANYSWDAVNKVLSVDAEAPDGYFRTRFETIANGSIT
jgi:hypothetical protein